MKHGFFKNHDDVVKYVKQFDKIFENPTRKDLRWQLAIDDDLLEDSIRQKEFDNWLKKVVIPKSAKNN